MPSPTEVIAIDGRPASPAMAAALAQIEANGRAVRARRELIDNDPRLLRLKAMKAAPITEHGTAGAVRLFREMENGTVARDARIARLMRARVGQLDKNRVLVATALRDAAACRRQHWSRPEPLTAPVVAGSVRLSDHWTGRTEPEPAQQPRDWWQPEGVL